MTIRLGIGKLRNMGLEEKEEIYFILMNQVNIVNDLNYKLWYWAYMQ